MGVRSILGLRSPLPGDLYIDIAAPWVWRWATAVLAQFGETVGSDQESGMRVNVIRAPGE